MNNMTTETMKETTRKVLGTAALFIGSFCVMGCVETPVKAQPSAAPSGLVDLTQAAETSVNAVVYIKVTTNSKTKTVDVQDPFSDFFGDFFGFGGGGRQQRQIQTPKREGSGSGVIISSDGYIVTNNHVVSEADELLVKLNDNREFKGRIIGTDEQTDLALIKIEGKDFPTLPIGNSDDLKLGEWVLAVGNPFNLTSTVTAGIVSAKARSMGANSIESFIQTDAAINRGNSGGALVNARGELVGINAMIYSQTGSYTGYGFAIPTTIMNKVVADLKEFGVVQRAQLGVMGNDVTRYIDGYFFNKYIVITITLFLLFLFIKLRLYFIKYGLGYVVSVKRIARCHHKYCRNKCSTVFYPFKRRSGLNLLSSVKACKLKNYSKHLSTNS